MKIVVVVIYVYNNHYVVHLKYKFYMSIRSQTEKKKNQY